VSKKRRFQPRCRQEASTTCRQRCTGTSLRPDNQGRMSLQPHLGTGLTAPRLCRLSPSALGRSFSVRRMDVATTSRSPGIEYCWQSCACSWQSCLAAQLTCWQRRHGRRGTQMWLRSGTSWWSRHAWSWQPALDRGSPCAHTLLCRHYNCSRWDSLCTWYLAGSLACLVRRMRKIRHRLLRLFPWRTTCIYAL